MTVEMDQLRGAIQALSHNGQQPVTHRMLWDALDVQGEPAKARVRSRLRDMLKRKELERIKDGVYLYHPRAQHKSGESYVRVWRFIRASKPGFSVQDCILITKISYRMANDYFRWLEEEGYLARHGGRGVLRLFRATGKAREQVETPYPPKDIPDPFARERLAAADLVRHFLLSDPCRPAVRRRILDACQVIQDRFVSEPETPETQEENHDS